MTDFLINEGFREISSCGGCGGKKVFKKEAMPGVVITTFRKSSSYHITRSNSVINRGQAHQLETEYQKLFT